MIAPLHKKRIVFAGGGTGGHLFPAVALARSLPFVDSVFLVPHDRGDTERLGGEFECVEFASPRFDASRVLYPARLLAAVRRARAFLKKIDAVAVVGLGGYASVPAAMAAKSLGRPLYLMECNAVPGKATRFLARFAAGIGLANEHALEGLGSRSVCGVFGTPLRGELEHGATPAEFGLDEDVRTLLVLGGSQGAMGLNDRVLAGLAGCAGLPFQVLHCAGQRDADRVRAAYAELPLRSHVIDFLPDIGRAYAVADLVLSRAGASTVAECLALGLPAVFVPYPWHKDRQQLLNAQDAVRTGAARIVEEAQLDETAVQSLVRHLLLDDDALARMAGMATALGKPAAARHMAAHLLESVGDAMATAQPVTELGG